MDELANEHGLEGVCGSIQIASRLESETFEADYRKISMPPIEIYIILDGNEYGRTEKLLRDCLNSHGEASLAINFSHRKFKHVFTPLEDLDLEAKSIYPITGFNLCSTLQDNMIVRAPKYKSSRETAVGLTLIATAASITTSIWNSVFSIYEITLAGKLQSQRLGVNLDNATVEIREYAVNQGGNPGYPKEAFLGIVSITREETVTYCSVTLYATEEILTRLAALLAGMSKGDTVRFDISVIAEGLPLKDGERKDFDVTGYTPVLMKSYC